MSQDDRTRWLTLYVLCVGMLMIVLDVTVVNVALPSIQDYLHFSTSSLAWVVNAYLIAFGGLLLLAGRFGDLVGRARIFLLGVALFTAASLLCGLAWTPDAARRRPLRPGRRRRDDLGGDPGDDRDDVPRAARAGQGDRRLCLRGLGRRLGRPAGGRRAHAVDRLALDLLRQHPDRDRHDRCSPGACSSTTRASASSRAPTSPAPLLITASLMLGVYTIVKPAAEHGWGAATTLAFGAGSLRAAGRLPRARGHGAQAADSAAHLPLAQRHRRER